MVQFSIPDCNIVYALCCSLFDQSVGALIIVAYLPAFKVLGEATWRAGPA